MNTPTTLTLTEVPTDRSNAQVWAVAGELDLGGVDRIRETLGAAVAPGRWLVLDLKELDFLDSAGLGAIIWLTRRTKESGGGLVLCALTRAVSRLVEISGVQAVIPVEYSVERALARLGTEPA